MKEGGQVITATDPTDEVDVGLGLKRGGENRADLAAVSGNTNPDGVSHHGCLPDPLGVPTPKAWGSRSAGGADLGRLAHLVVSRDEATCRDLRPCDRRDP